MFHAFTIHTMRPADRGDGEQLSSRFVAADNIQAALAALGRPAHPEAALREGERPIGWSPEASKSFGGSKRHTQLWEEAKAAGRVVYEIATGYEPAIAGQMVRELLRDLKSRGPSVEVNAALIQLAHEVAARAPLDAASADAKVLRLLGYKPADDDNVVDAEVKTGPAMTPAAADALLVAAVASVSTPTPEAAKASATQEQGGGAPDPLARMQASDEAGRQRSLERELARHLPLATKAPAKPNPFAVSPDLQPSRHQVAAPHGSALLLGEGQA